MKCHVTLADKPVRYSKSLVTIWGLWLELG